MNFPQDVEDLFHWDYYTHWDKTYGNYTVITGFEGQGGCFWCGEELNGRSKKFCYGHWTQYWKHFGWTFARNWCLERSNYQCTNCGHHLTVPPGDHPSWYAEGLEAHHIIPLEGETRSLSPYNVPWNLICLCHACHLELHSFMRELKRLPPDIFDQALTKGQAGFELLRLL